MMGTGLQRNRGAIHGAIESRPVERPLEIRVLRGAEVRLNGVPMFDGKLRIRAMLCYLALQPDWAAPRHSLASLLWPDAPEANALSSLRQVVFESRQTLTRHGVDALIVGRQMLSLNKHNVSVDVDDMMRRIARNQAPELAPAKTGFAEAILVDVEHLSDLFLEWIRQVRRQLAEEASRALVERISDEALPPETRRSMATAALAIDPLNEVACRVLMRLSANAGEVGVALRAYEALYRAFDESMDNEPSLQTQQLAVEIKQSGPADADAPEPEPELPPAKEAVQARVLGDARGEPRLAVLPFVSLGPDPVPDYITRGIAEDTICFISRLREPVAISSNSSGALDGGNVDYGRIRELLGVDYVVVGSIRRMGEDHRIAVQLIDIAKDQVLWAEAYEAAAPNVLATHCDIAASIALTLAPKLHKAELMRTRGRSVKDLNIYHLTLRARELTFRLRRPNFDEAGDLLQEARQRDPAYSPALVNLASWYSIRLGQGWSDDVKADLEALEDVAQDAVSEGDATGRALAMLGHNYMVLNRKYSVAMSMFERAAATSPNDAEALMWSVPTFAYMGEPDEAIQRINRAISLSPQDPFMFRYEHFRSIAHYAAGDFDEAARWGESAYMRNPAYLSNLRMTSAALAGAGRYDDARVLTKRAMELEPNFRVETLMRRSLFRDPVKQTHYGDHLISAGLPP